MANPAAGTVNDLIANGFLADPAGDTFDTGTNGAPASLDYDVGGVTEKVFFRVKNTEGSAINIVVGMAAGGYPPAFKSQLGAYASANLAQNAIGWYGPFSSAQFIQNGTKAGKLEITLTPASGTLAAVVTCFRLPKV